MRWVLLLLAFGAFAIAFSTRSPGVMGFALIVGIGLLFAAVFAFAAAKISATSRPDSTLLTDKDINAIRASIRKKAPKPVDPSAGE